MKARIIKTSKVAGSGAAVQAVGLLLCLTVIGAIAGIPMMIIGGRMAIKWKCSNCGNYLTGKHVKICPVCGFHFS